MKFKITELASNGQPFIVYVVEERDRVAAIDAWLRRAFPRTWDATATTPDARGAFRVTGRTPGIPAHGIVAHIQTPGAQTLERLAPLDPRD